MLNVIRQPAGVNLKSQISNQIPQSWQSFFYTHYIKLYRMNSTSKVLVGVLAGVAAGVVVGMLFAPDSGEETRRKIGESYSGLSESLKNKFTDLVDSIKDEYGYAKDKVSDLAGKAGKEAANMKAEARDTYTG
jgi:gas vesicle protein